NRIAVGVPWPGRFRPLRSITWVRSLQHKTSSISLLPNDLVIKAFDTIIPIHPECSPFGSSLHRVRLKKRSVNGTPIWYLPWHDPYRCRYVARNAESLTFL